MPAHDDPQSEVERHGGGDVPREVARRGRVAVELTDRWAVTVGDHRDGKEDRLLVEEGADHEDRLVPPPEPPREERHEHGAHRDDRERVGQPGPDLRQVLPLRCPLVREPFAHPHIETTEGAVFEHVDDEQPDGEEDGRQDEPRGGRELPRLTMERPVLQAALPVGFPLMLGSFSLRRYHGSHVYPSGLPAAAATRTGSPGNSKGCLFRAGEGHCGPQRRWS